MTEWYYSDAQRQQQGPVGSEELASLHGRGLLAPDSLVWREGLPAWVPWREIMHEVVSGDTATASMSTSVSTAVPASDTSHGSDPFAAPAATEPFAVADPFAITGPSPAGAAPSAGDDAYRPYAIAEASPYAPPQASVAGADAGYVAGGHVVHAGLWKRLAASVIDSFITTILSYAILIPVMLIGFGSMGAMGGGNDPFAAGAGMAAVLLMYPIMFVVPSLYFGWMQSSSMQASLGKMAVGIKVVRGDGTRVTFWRAFLRSLFYVVFGAVTCGLGVLISGLMAALTERKQALHDMVCDTLVVDKHAFTEHPEWQREELGVVTIVILVLFGLLVVGMIAAYAILGVMMLGGMGN